jgi:DNA-directed RNA polymerase subunit RPC12/RpoP
MSNVEELTKALCKASGCHHLCSNTEGCVVEEEARAILDKYELVPKQKELPSTLTNEEKVSEKDKLLLINENKSNNFDVKSNEELFKQALVEGVNRHIDKAIAEIKVITYEQDRLNHFIDRMEKAQKKYDRLYKRYKDSPHLSEGTTLLSDAGRKLQFYKDVIAMLEQDNRKQSEGEWIAYPDEHWICATEFVCSNCKESFSSSEMTDKEFLEMMQFCPNCGSKMKGGE